MTQTLLPVEPTTGSEDWFEAALMTQGAIPSPIRYSPTRASWGDDEDAEDEVPEEEVEGEESDDDPDPFEDFDEEDFDDEFDDDFEEELEDEYEIEPADDGMLEGHPDAEALDEDEEDSEDPPVELAE